LATSFVCEIYNHFEEVTDPRVNRGANHPLIEMIFLTLCASICDAEGWVDVERYGNAKLDWLRKFFPFQNGIPSHDTLGRVFSRLDTLEFYAALQSWTNEIAGSLRGQTIADHRNVTIPLRTRWLTPNGTDFSEISRNTIRLARYLRNES
jgi:hypothetical protein